MLLGGRRVPAPFLSEKGLRMKCAVVVLAGMLSAGMLWAFPVKADEALAKKYNCFMCHSVQAKVVGPAYKDVAKKYKGQPDAAAKLAAEVKAGSTGVWGPIPMPPNAAVPDADIKALVAWILKLD